MVTATEKMSGMESTPIVGDAKAGHWFGPKKTGGSPGNGHPLMFSFKSAEDFGPFPDGGGYPLRFLKRAYEALGVTNPDEVLHLCSGSMHRGIRVDIRPEVNPTVCCDARNTPFDDASFRWIMCDPPYSKDYATNLYGTGEKYPSPGSLLKEASRLLVPGGAVGFLHFQVPMFRKPLKLEAVYGITTGLGYAIRAFTVFRKAETA